MVHTGALQLNRSDSGTFYSLCDKCVDIIKLRFTDIDINTAKDIDCSRDCFPVECNIVCDIEIQVFIQCLDRLFRTAKSVCRVDLIICVLIVHIQVSITEYGCQFDLTCLTI